jgi:ATP-binding cassette subfamily B (MDR/TAP) protein 1
MKLTLKQIDMAQAAAAANRILSFRKRENLDSKATLELQDTDGGVKIELRDVWFKYPTRDIPIFSGINLTVGTVASYLLITLMSI